MAFLFGDSNRKKELYSKILATSKPEAKSAVCALYDSAEGKCAEGLSVRSIAQIAARGMMGTPTADPEWALHWILGPTFADRAGMHSLASVLAVCGRSSQCKYMDAHSSIRMHTYTHTHTCVYTHAHMNTHRPNGRTQGDFNANHDVHGAVQRNLSYRGRDDWQPRR